MTDRPTTKNPWFAMPPMRRAIGIVLIVIGGVWFLQGIGVAQDSVMTGSTLWAILGAACFIAGVVVLRRALFTARQNIERASTPIDEDTEDDTTDDTTDDAGHDAEEKTGEK
jgi:hypothetical protein